MRYAARCPGVLCCCSIWSSSSRGTLRHSAVTTPAHTLNFSLCVHAVNRWVLLAVTAGLRTVWEPEFESSNCLYGSFTSSSSHMLFTRIAVRLLWRAACCKARLVICWGELKGWAGCSGPGGDGFQWHVNQPWCWQMPTEPQTSQTARWPYRSLPLYIPEGKWQRVEGDC